MIVLLVIGRLKMGYKTLYIDPPWMETGGGKIKRGADRHYPLMKTKDIIELLKSEILPQADENCHLYLWVTNNFLKDGLKVVEELGFKYITLITWMKDRAGLGQYFRGMTESCIFARRGMLPYKLKDGKRQQGVTGFTEKRGEHSVKPIKMRQMIERVSYEPRLEVFARHESIGWDVFGNEVNKNPSLNRFIEKID